MSTENQVPDPYDAVLADLRAKRDQIDQTIALLSSLRGGGTPAAVSAGSTTADNGIVETAGMFLGMSIADASKKLLAMRKRTMGNVEISRELQAGGLVLTGADPVNVIGSVLTRRFNQVGDVVKVGRGIWGLKEWYPGRTFKSGGRNLTVISAEQNAIKQQPPEPTKEGSLKAAFGIKDEDANPEGGQPDLGNWPTELDQDVSS